jgi:hypothetical protein
VEGVSVTLRWFMVERYYEYCGGHGCVGRYEMDIVAAEDERSALDLADDEDALSARVAPLTLPDLTRKRRAFIHPIQNVTLKREHAWESH